MQRHGVTQSYDLMYQGEFLTKINLSVPGIHNVYNSLAAITVADYLGVPIKDIAENIAKFTGVHRRFELLGKPNGITVVDDFAHHPTELTSTLETAMELGFNHVWAVFQPHTFSRTALLMARKFQAQYALKHLMKSLTTLLRMLKKATLY